MRLRKAIGLSLALLFIATTALAKQAHSGHHHAAASLKAKHAKPEAASRKAKRQHQRTSRRLAARAPHRGGRHARHDAEAETAPLPPPDRYIGPLTVIGNREIGEAAWYGGSRIGARTASGERLDAVRPTAAHRSLPLYSLVRVTNLRNGRSVIAKITDRGPVSHNLLIDVSPKAAQELDMIRSGIARVSVEPVAPTPAAAAQQQQR